VRFRNRPVWILVFVLFGLVLAFSCGRERSSTSAAENADSTRADAAAGSDTSSQATGPGAEEGSAPSDDEEPVPVDVAVLERGAIEAVLRSSASLEAESQVGVFSEAARRVEQILVEEGDEVHAGDLLLRLQDDEQRSRLARVRSQLARAEREFERQQELHTRDLTSDLAFNDAAYELDQQRIALADAERELSYTEVRAPVRGTITARLVNVGDQVQIGQQLFDIIDFESLVARIYVPEKNLRELKTGLPARIFAPAVTDEVLPGSVLRIAPVVDPRSGTVKVTVQVGELPGLRPGLFVDVQLVTAVHEDALLVPKRALVHDGDLVYVYRLGEGRRAERVRVEPVLADRDFVEPAAALATGDTVVVAGQAGLEDGALVELVGERTEPEPTEETGS
jgi:membrane fusion protein (multidrug efflux system)